MEALFAAMIFGLIAAGILRRDKIHSTTANRL